MKLFDLLKKDHRTVEQIFSQIEGSEGGSRQEQLFEKLKEELELHTQLEENHFYPALEKHEDTKEYAEEGEEEHDTVKALLEEISELSVGTKEWTDKCKELKASVQHHVEEEENEMFPAAEKTLGEAQLDEIAGRVEKEKAQAKAV